MTDAPTTAPLDDASFLALLHHVVFRMTPEQAAALMADDELIDATAPLRPAFHGHETCFLDTSL
jgi:hypothetical protein